jgi:hypothetical protein
LAPSLARFLLTPSHFHYPMGLTAWHMLFGSVISFFLCRVFHVSPQACLRRIASIHNARDVGSADAQHGYLHVHSMCGSWCAPSLPSAIRIAWALLAVGAMFALSLFLTNSAYMHLTVAYNTMLNAMLPERNHTGVEACALRCPSVPYTRRRSARDF